MSFRPIYSVSKFLRHVQLKSFIRRNPAASNQQHKLKKINQKTTKVNINSKFSHILLANNTLGGWNEMRSQQALIIARLFNSAFHPSGVGKCFLSLSFLRFISSDFTKWNDIYIAIKTTVTGEYSWLRVALNRCWPPENCRVSDNVVASTERQRRRIKRRNAVFCVYSRCC